MQKSESITALAKALVAAQRALRNPRLDSTNPAFRSKYASLTAVRDAVVPVMAESGISVLQHLTTSDGHLHCETVLLHESGEWLSSTLAMPIGPKQTGHAVLAAATYARRGALMAVAGVVGDPDDDGNTGSLASDSAGSAPEQGPATAAQRREIEALLKETGSDRAKFLAYLKLESVDAMNSQQYFIARQALLAKQRSAA